MNKDPGSREGPALCLDHTLRVRRLGTTPGMLRPRVKRGLVSPLHGLCGDPHQAGENAVKQTEVKAEHCWVLCFVTEAWKVLEAGLAVISDYGGHRLTGKDWKVPSRGLPFTPRQPLQAGYTMNFPGQCQPSALVFFKGFRVTF